MSKKQESHQSEALASGAAARSEKRRVSRAKTPRVQTSEGSSSVSLEEQPAAAAATTHGRVDREAIARLAYSYWETRGFTGGSAEEDWLRAEQELGFSRTKVARA